MKENERERRKREKKGSEKGRETLQGAFFFGLSFRGEREREKRKREREELLEGEEA